MPATPPAEPPDGPASAVPAPPPTEPADGPASAVPAGRKRWRHRVPQRLRLAIAAGVVGAVAMGATALAALSPWSDSGDEPGGDRGGIAGAGSPAPGSPTTPDEPGARARPPAEPGTEIPAEFPDGTTTGVRDGAALARSGSVQVTDDGAILENLLVVDGTIEVLANDVTIRNVRVTNESELVYWGIVQAEGFSGLVVEDSEVFGNGETKLQTGINNDGGMITIRRVEIHTITDGIMTSHGLIEDNYLHSPALFPDDHTDMIQTVGGSRNDLPLEIRHNTVINTEPQTAAIMLDDATGTPQLIAVRDTIVEGNLLAGGGFTIYGGGLLAEGHDPSGIVIRGNVFSRDLWPDCGYYGPVAYFDTSAPGNAWTDNVWDDGSSLPFRSG